MLKSLYIKDYAIISELLIDLSNGFNVFTGETGAGKSIIVGALSYLIKGKADTSIIRTGCDKTIIEGVFTIEDYMKQSLDDAGIDYDDELIIRRIISRDNHNTIRINQCSVTLNFLSDLFNEHIDIHSQKDSQYLLNKKNHLKLLDKYASDNEMLNQYKAKYDEYINVLKEYEELINNTYNESEIDYIRFDLNELDEAKIDIDEENELLSNEKRYKSAEKYITSLSNAIGLYDSDNGISERLSTLLKELNIDDDKLNNIKSEIESINYNLSDQIDELRKVLNSFTDDDLNIEYIEERLYTYSRLKRKHNTDTNGLLDKIKQLKDKLIFFEDRDFVLNEKKKALDALKLQADQLANKLHDLRSEKAKLLEESVVKESNDLLLNNVVFKVDIKETELNPNGIDDVEFFISLNKGEELKPLKNVASGGEISRIMLALKSVFTKLSDTSLIIFDEIDSGVSGKTALSVGQKMAKIASDTQVLTITHLAAVAACADNHYYIYKNDEKGYSNTSIKKLNKDEIINELAFISNADNSEASIEAAKKLYYSAQESVK